MTAQSRDWFVAVGARLGEGSRDKPFDDPWLALRSAGPGDTIHIATGTYFGRYDRSSWIVDCPKLTVKGGYSRDFSQRTPWRTPSVFAIFPNYEGSRENNLLSTRGESSELLLDGIFFDSAGRNLYDEKPGGGIRAYSAMDGPILSLSADGATIRNCVFANGATGGLELSGDGSCFENNLVISMIGKSMLELRSGAENKEPIRVLNNTFCFAHDVDLPAGAGGDQAIGIRVNRSAVIQDNAFLSCGNAAIAVYFDIDSISIDRNLFYITPRDVVNSRQQGNSGEVTEGNIDELEDLGFQSAVGNVVQDPGISGFKPEWLDAYTRHLIVSYINPPYGPASALRTAVGLPPLTRAELEKAQDKGSLAPRLGTFEVLGLQFRAQQGFHVIELATDFAGQSAGGHPTYLPVDWTAIEDSQPSLVGKGVELRAGLGFEHNVVLLSDADPANYMAVQIYQPISDDGSSVYVLIKRYTLPNRQFEEAIKFNEGREVESTYFLRGVYRTDIEPSSRQKVALIVESILPAPLLTANPASRPRGRDWFVRAGAQGGDGTREKPFRDPFQALEKAGEGDTICVAGAEYFGKLHSGKWHLLTRNLTLLGGYDPAFNQRDPWNNPTRFLLTEEEKNKGVPEGTILQSEENSDGLILDGFIFDGASYNTYAPSNSLQVRGSPSNPLVKLRGGESPITVRNCLFINASGSAVSIACPFGTFENNLVLNSSGLSLEVSADGPGPWTVRNNTILFAGDPTSRAGTGKSSAQGTLFDLRGRAVAAVDSNVFGFADNFGVRVTIPQQNVSFVNNVFAANLYIHLTDTEYLWADSATWERRAVEDSAFASFKGNSLELPKLLLDPSFADIALTRHFAITSRVSSDEWKNFAAKIGSSVRPSIKSADTAPTEVPPSQKTATRQESSSLSGLLASLSSAQESMKRADEKRADEKEKAASKNTPSEPIYCPAYDWKKALSLLLETPNGEEPGAHRMKVS